MVSTVSGNSSHWRLRRWKAKREPDFWLLHIYSIRQSWSDIQKYSRNGSKWQPHPRTTAWNPITLNSQIGSEVLWWEWRLRSIGYLGFTMVYPRKNHFSAPDGFSSIMASDDPLGAERFVKQHTWDMQIQWVYSVYT